MHNNLLLEILTEEIPAGYIEPALSQLEQGLREELHRAGIAHEQIKTYATPRRLVILINQVAGVQQNETITMKGPPARIGYDQDGNPTMAAQKFAEKAGIAVTDIQIQDLPKGKYLWAEIKKIGEPTSQLLKKIIPKTILALSFPKTMRWGAYDLTFARPLHSILCLYGQEVISFQVGPVQSGCTTSGHRFVGNQSVKINDYEHYFKMMRQLSVLVDLCERRNVVVSAVNAAAQNLGGQVFKDNELVDIVTNLVEFPVVTTGNFDHEFLDLPPEILITAMREHQKYFAVKNSKGLLPFFITINNTPANNLSLVVKGHERVLRARLADATFFYQKDRKNSLANMTASLEGVLLHKKLGSVRAKVDRIQALADFIAQNTSVSKTLRKYIAKAALLCKADLNSQVVVEFPKLQGVMGRVYATLEGEPQQVATAIEEHYRPVSSGAPLPTDIVGAIVGLADKIDSICGCFSVGLIPTGAADPYALRRQGIGSIQIMLSNKMDFALSALLEKSLSLFSNEINTLKINGQVRSFLAKRMTNLLVDQGFSRDTILAVTSVSVDHIPNIWKRVECMEKLKKLPDFKPLAETFKRVVNIIRKSAQNVKITEHVTPALFTDQCETQLYQQYLEISTKVKKELETNQFEKALELMVKLKVPVDAFFETVMVMSDDEQIRANRLAILQNIIKLFEQIADFSKIST